jgi:hypothetical protein
MIKKTFNFYLSFLIDKIKLVAKGACTKYNYIFSISKISSEVIKKIPNIFACLISKIIYNYLTFIFVRVKNIFCPEF